MRSFRIWTETCKRCNPWTRVIVNPSTNIEAVQAMHEPHCTAFPNVQRVDVLGVDRG